ncbi:MAG: arabinofuranosyltransferase [Planctomycetota bacterium]|jgi:arabinofuranosyltransferase
MKNDNTPLSKRLLIWAIAALPLAWFIWQYRWLCDDAFISFRYSKNLAEGMGLRYNVADTAVEGYSNFLWVVWLAALKWLGASIPSAAQWSSALSAFVLLWLVTSSIVRNNKGALWQLLLAPLVLATLPPVAVWSTSGLATMPMVCCVFWVWDLLLGDTERCRWRAAALVSFAGVLMRADAILFLGIIHAGAFFSGILAGNDKLRLGAFKSSVVTLATFGSQTLFRYLYHGDWLPNTARVKTGMSAMTIERGWKYDVEFLLSYPAIITALLLVVFFPGRGARSQRMTAGAVVVGVLCYCVYIGGDFMAMGRMLIVVLPFIAVLLAGSLARLGALKGRALGTVLATGIVGFCLANSVLASQGKFLVPESLRAPFHFRWNSPVYVSEQTQWKHMVERSGDWVRLGKALKRYTKPGESLVIGTIGGVGFYSDLHIYDSFGLTYRTQENAEPMQKRRSPGHDRHIPIRHFLTKDPTYVGAELVPRENPGFMLLPHLRPDFEFAPLIQIGFFPLKGDKRLLRLARWGSGTQPK